MHASFTGFKNTLNYFNLSLTMHLLSQLPIQASFKRLASCKKQLLSGWKLSSPRSTDSSSSFSLGNSKHSETLQPFDAACTSLLVENINHDTQSWMCKRIESTDSKKLSHLDKITTLNRLMLVHCFEVFLLKEGPFLKAESSFCDCEVALPAICTLIDAAVKYEVDSFVIGLSQLKMLNVLSKMLNISMEKLFLSIVDCRKMISGADIVSYYMNSNMNNNNNLSVTFLGSTKIPQTLCPLTLGVTKGLQEMENSKSIDKVWSIQCYCANDIADKNTFTNIVQLSTESKYSSNGCVHIVINESEDDISPKTESQCKFIKIFADFIKAPIVHVKAEDVDSVINVMHLAADFKATYKRDIVIDLITAVNQNYPTIKKLTLPGLVKQLMTADKPPLAAAYLGDLVQNKVVADISYSTKRTETLTGLQTFYSKQNVFNEDFIGDCNKSTKEVDSELTKGPLTSSPINVLSKIGTAISEKPFSIDLTAETLNLLSDRKKQLEEDKLSWSMCELLAYGSLLYEGIDVHMSCSRKCTKPSLNVACRGSGAEKCLLSDLSPYLGSYKALSSFISHYAVAGFEAGYSSVMTNSLGIWSAPEDIQPKNLLKIMHDYLSCAAKELKTKVTFIIPNYIFATEKNSKVFYSTQTKQVRNIIETITESDTNTSMACEVVNVSTPSNFYHLLKRQAKCSKQKPLLIFVPFEYHKCSKNFSPIQELSGETCFKPFMEEGSFQLDRVKNVILCSGTVFHYLKEEIIKRELEESIAVGRIEQLYPFPMNEVLKFIGKFQTKNIWWVQDEQYEDGWWSYVDSKLNLKGIKLKYAGRTHATQPSYKCPKITEANLSHIFETLENTEMNSIKQ